MSDFFDDLLLNLVDDAIRVILPRGTRFLSYNQETFTFVQRRDSGNTVLHEAKARPLDLVRRGFAHEHFTRFKLVRPTDVCQPGERVWQPHHTLYAAPEGTYVMYVTRDPSADANRDRPYVSYGVVNGGAYTRITGTTCAGVPQGYFRAWQERPVPISIRNGYIWINGDNTPGPYDLYRNPEVLGPDTDLAELGNHINQYLNSRQSYFFNTKPKPSPFYYDASSWKQDDDGNWTFSFTP